MSRERSIHAVLLSVLLSGTAFAQGTGEEPATPPETTAAVTEAAPEPAPPPIEGAPGFAITPEIIKEVQERLQALGFDPGSTDGNTGSRTRRAIRAYQQAMGLEQTGKITEELYRVLTAPKVVEEPPIEPAAGPSPTAGTAAEAAGQPDILSSIVDCSAIARSEWRFFDSSGAVLLITLDEDGAVAGPPYPERWSWRGTANGIEIRYDSGVGMTAQRRGKQQERDLLVGEGSDTRGRTWTWEAKRVRWLAPVQQRECKLKGQEQDGAGEPSDGAEGTDS